MTLSRAELLSPGKRCPPSRPTSPPVANLAWRGCSISCVIRKSTYTGMGMGNLAAGADGRHYDDQGTLWRYPDLYHRKWPGAKDPIIAGEVVDDPRIDYLSSHIGALERGAGAGGGCARLLSRSFIDLLSWLNGYQKQCTALSMSITSKIWHANERRVFIGTNLLLPVTANSVNLLLRAPFGAGLV